MLLTNASRVAGTVAALALVVGCTAASQKASANPATSSAVNPAQNAATGSPGAARSSAEATADQEFRKLEKEFEAKVGVYALDTGTGRSVSFRADQRFAYASTFKALQAGVLLQQTSDQELEKVIHYSEADLLEYAPITKEHVDTGMTLRELADASVRYSDNTAANLLFAELGGPQKVDKALERIGDRTTHMDRTEPTLNEATPGDVRDTSTPRAFATDLRKFVLDNALNRKDKAILTDLLKRNTTGDKLIRAGVPQGWTVGDKTGSGGYGTRNDIAVLWPPQQEPIVLAVMTNHDEQDATYDDALIARAAEVVVDQLS